MRYPLYQFSCDCILDKDEIDLQRKTRRGRKLICHDHMGEKIDGVLVGRAEFVRLWIKCVDCHKVVEVSKKALTVERCPKCAALRIAKKYEARLVATRKRTTRFHKKKHVKPDAISRMVITDLSADPKSLSSDRSPCATCDVFQKIGRYNNSTCTKCLLPTHYAFAIEHDLDFATFKGYERSEAVKVGLELKMNGNVLVDDKQSNAVDLARAERMVTK